MKATSLKVTAISFGIIISVSNVAQATANVGPDVPVNVTSYSTSSTCITFQFKSDVTGTRYAMDPNDFGGSSTPQFQEAMNLLNIAVASKTRTMTGYADGSIVSACSGVQGHRFKDPQLQ